MTITDGRGLVLSDDRSETMADAHDDHPAPPRRGRQVTALALAAAVGFGAATVLAEQRQRALEDSPEGVLSLDLGPQPSSWDADLVPYDGGLAVQASLVLRNTGPRDVGLDAVVLGDTGYAADDVEGRRMSSGGTTTVRLLHPVRCDDLPSLDPVGPLRVRAMTGAGMRTTSVRMDTEGVDQSSRFAAAACGRSGPLQSLIPMDTPPAKIVGNRAHVAFELSSASSSPLLVESLQVRPGLELVSLQDPAGAEVDLPLRLAPGDYDPPAQPMDGRGPAQRLVAVVELTDCTRPAPPTEDEPELYEPLFQATVTDGQGRDDDPGQDVFYGGFGPGGLEWGDPALMGRLRDSACPLRQPG